MIGRGSRRLLWGVALALILVATALRLWVSWPNPSASRFWDERYLVANTASTLSEGPLRPEHSYYPGLGHLVPAAVLASIDWLGLAERTDLVENRVRLAPAGYRVSRATSVAWSAIGLLFVLWLGRRIGGWPVGLLAVLLVALAPWHLRQSSLFKPDAALCALVVASLWSLARLAQRGTAGASNLAWLLCALACSTKPNAAPLLAPLLLATAHRWRVDGSRALRRALVAALLALAVTVLVNPPLLFEPSSYVRDMTQTADHYEGKAAKIGTTRLDVPRYIVAEMSDPWFLGRWFGGIGWLGLLLLAARSVTRFRFREVAAGPSMENAEVSDLVGPLCAVFVAAYVVAWSAASSFPSQHHWLPILPPLAISAVWLLVAGARRAGALLSRRSSALGRWGTVVVGLVAVAIPLGLRARTHAAFVSDWAVPTTTQRAEQILREDLGDLSGRIIVSDQALSARLRSFAVQARTLDPRDPRALVLTPEAGRSPADFASFADAGVWRAASGCVTPAIRIQGDGWRARGPDLCLATAAKALVFDSGWIEVPTSGHEDLASLELGRGDLWSVEIRVLPVPGQEVSVVLERGTRSEEEIVCHVLRRSDRRWLCQTNRIESLAGVRVRPLESVRKVWVRARGWKPD